MQHTASRLEAYAKDAKNKTKYIEYIGEHPELISGKKYTYAELGAVCGIVDHSMRGRLRGRNVCTDDRLWKKGERLPKELWAVTTIERCESDADKLSQKYLRMSL